MTVKGWALDFVGGKRLETRGWNGRRIFVISVFRHSAFAIIPYPIPVIILCQLWHSL